MTKPSAKHPSFALISLIILSLIAAGVLIAYSLSSIDKLEETIRDKVTQNLPREKTFNAQEYYLDNGLQIVVIPNHRAPIVTHMVWYKTGAADEQAGRSGIAHFLEHLMFKGSEALAPGEFSTTVRALGGQDNAFTSYDYTAYFQSVVKEALPTVMKMEAGRMRGLNPPLEETLSEHAVILEERRQRTDNDPSAQFREQLRAQAFINHPYGRPVIGWPQEMEQLDWAMAKDFYDRHYGPNNAILVVTGDVTGDEVLALAQDIYGPLPSIDVPPRQRTLSPPPAGQASLSLSTEAVQQAQLSILIRAPSLNQDKQSALALELVQEIMSGGAATRLYKALVVEQKLASAVNLYYDSAAVDDSLISINAYPAPQVSLETLKAAILKELHALAVSGVTESELATAKQKAKDSAVFARDSLSGPAFIIGQNLTVGGALDDIEYWPYDIAAITAETVQNVAARYLDPQNPQARITYGLLSPKPAEKPAPETAQIKQAEPPPPPIVAHEDEDEDEEGEK